MPLNAKVSRASDWNVSRETEEKLRQFAQLVKAWTTKINLISKGDSEHIWDRHIMDSLQLSSLVDTSGTHWLDIGSGGGFPGIVLAIQHAETRPDIRHTLIESDQRKAAFMLTAATKLDLNISVLIQRSEQAEPQGADVITARAFAPLHRLLGHVDRHLDPSGQAILPKGAGVDTEILAAKEEWCFNFERFPSTTSPTATILKVTEISRA